MSNVFNEIGICVASEITDLVCGQLECSFGRFDGRIVKFERIEN